jgi:hypothetical protein
VVKAQGLAEIGTGDCVFLYGPRRPLEAQRPGLFVEIFLVGVENAR